jgi:hypothetical protein
MKKSLNLRGFTLILMFIFSVFLLIGCSSGENLQSQVSGTWQRTQSEGTVEINLAKKPTSMKIDDKIYPSTIEKIDKGKFSVYLKVENGAGQKEDWTLQQVWDDNGSTFKIAFIRNGTKEILKSKTST